MLLNLLLSFFVLCSTLSNEQWSGKNPYKILGISSSASASEVRKAVRRASAQWHPDKISSTASEKEQEEAVQMYAYIREAGEILTDTVKRNNYDSVGDPSGRPAFAHSGFRRQSGRGRYQDFAQQFHSSFFRTEPIRSEVPDITRAAEWYEANMLSPDAIFLVEVYSEASGACRAFAPEFDKVARNLANIAVVRRMSIRQVGLRDILGSVYAPHQLPSLFAHVDGAIYEYAGDMRLRPIAHWFATLLPREAVLFGSDVASMSAEALSEGGRRVVAYLFSAKSQEPPPLAIAASLATWDHVTLVYVTPQDEAFDLLRTKFRGNTRTLPALGIAFDVDGVGRTSAAPLLVTRFDSGQHSLRAILDTNRYPTVPRLSADTFDEFCRFQRRPTAGGRRDQTCILVESPSIVDLPAQLAVRTALDLHKGTGPINRRLGRRSATEVTLLWHTPGEAAALRAALPCADAPIVAVQHYSPDRVRCAALRPDDLAAAAATLSSGWPRNGQRVVATHAGSTVVSDAVSDLPVPAHSRPISWRWYLRRSYNVAYQRIVGTQTLSSLAGTAFSAYILFLFVKQLLFPAPRRPDAARAQGPDAAAGTRTGAASRGADGPSRQQGTDVFRWLELRSDRVEMFRAACAPSDTPGAERAGRLLLVTIESAARDADWYDDGQFMHSLASSTRGNFMAFAWLNAKRAPDVVAALLHAGAGRNPSPPKAFVIGPSFVLTAVLYTETLRSRATVSWIDTLLSHMGRGTLEEATIGDDVIRWHPVDPIFDLLPGPPEPTVSRVQEKEEGEKEVEEEGGGGKKKED
jgi:hypothetical protein